MKKNNNLIQAVIKGETAAELNFNNLDAVVQAYNADGELEGISNDFLQELDFYDLKDVAKNLLLNHHDINNVRTVDADDLEYYEILIRDCDYISVIEELVISTAEALSDFFITHKISGLAWITGLSYSPSVEIVIYDDMYTAITEY